MRTRKAILPDAEQIHELIGAYSGDGTLLPRTLPEICENVRDFVVLEDDGRIIGCGALHLYGTHLAEIRSITVARGRREKAAAGGWSKLCWRRRSGIGSVASACSPASRISLRVRDSRWRSARIFPTRSTKTATLVRGCIAATKWRWCAANCRSSRFFRNRRIGW